MATIKPSWRAVVFVGGILAAITILLLYWYGPVVSVKNTVKSTNITAGFPSRPQVIVQKVGKEKQLYRFSGDPGCVSVELRSDAEFYPKGGEVEITPPLPGKSWHDKPGTQNDLPRQKEGTFKVCKIDPDAWGVEIWN